MPTWYSKTATDTAITTAVNPVAAAVAAAQSYAVQRGNHTGTQTADTITDGTTNKAYTGTEKTKLAGIAAGATANRADSATDQAIAAATAALVNAAPGTLDTLGELAAQLASDENAAAALTTLVGQKSLSLPVNTIVPAGSSVRTAVIGARNSVNASTGPVTVALPTPTAVGQHLIIERADTSRTTANAITVTGTIRNAPSNVVLAAVGAAYEGALYIAESLTSWAISSSIKPRAVLDATYRAPNQNALTAGRALYDALTLAVGSAALSVHGDSTGAGTERWPGLLGILLAARFPAYTVRHRLWNDTTQLYDAPTYWNGSAWTAGGGPAGALRGVQINTFGLPYTGAAISADIDVSAIVTPTAWVPAANSTVAARMGAAGSRAWRLYISTSGKLNLVYTTDGTTAVLATSSVATGMTGTAGIRATLTVATGVVTFYTSTDWGQTWVQLGTTVATSAGAAVTVFPASTTPYTLGAWGNPNTSELFLGTIHEVWIRSGINGPAVAPVIPERWGSNGAAPTYVGTIVLDIVNGSKPSVDLSYHDDATRGPKLIAPFGQAVAIVSSLHNQAQYEDDLLAAHKSFLTRLRTALPYAALIETMQNPRVSPALAITAHARRNAIIPMLTALGTATATLDAYRYVTLMQSDGIHPTWAGNDGGVSPNGSQQWANAVYDELGWGR